MSRQCTFCPNAATTKEHCPPKILFTGKDRPKGWEFDACKSCNNGTSDSDQIFSLFVYSNILHQSAAQERHTEKLISGVRNNQREIVEEFVSNASPTWLGSTLLGLSRGPVITTLGPGMRSHMDRVANKLAKSAFKQKTGTTASGDWLVSHQWYTNSDILAKKVPKLDIPFSELEFIGQGKKTSDGQFAFQWWVGNSTAAAFRFFFQNRVILISLLVNPSENERTKYLNEGFKPAVTGLPKKPHKLSLASPNQIIRPLSFPGIFGPAPSPLPNGERSSRGLWPRRG